MVGRLREHGTGQRPAVDRRAGHARARVLSPLLGVSLAPVRDADHSQSPVRPDRRHRVLVAERAIPECAGVDRLHRAVRPRRGERDRAGVLY